jgi:glutaredoxin-like protein NrdH
VITVYSKPDCVQCKFTYKKADQLGIPYTVVDITEDKEARDMVVGMGYQQAPVVVAGDQHWSGFKPHHLEAIARGKTP